MGFFKDYKDEADEVINSLTEEDINNILGDELLDINEDLSDDYDEEIDEDLLYSLLSEDEQEAEQLYDDEEELAEQDINDNVKSLMPVISQVQNETIKNARTEVKESLSEEDKRAVTVITKGTTVNGSIISDCSLDVMGMINGDVECLGKLSISGKVIGNISAAEVYINADRLEGNITSEGAVKIGLGSVVVGNISAATGVIAGAVKGEIDVEGPIVVDSTAIIKGNIKAGSIQMGNGAVVEGFCSLCNPSLDIDTIFE